MMKECGGYNYQHTYDIFITPKRKEAQNIQGTAGTILCHPAEMLFLALFLLKDLLGKIQGELPSTIHDISVSGCAVHTRSPHDFTAGDLAVISFILPDAPYGAYYICFGEQGL